MNKVSDERLAELAQFAYSGRTANEMLSALRELQTLRQCADALQERVARAEADTKRIDHLDAQRKWGDCFTIQVMDSGDFYVRPWRYANQSLLNGSGDPLGATYTAYQTIREAIDASLSAKEGP